MERQRQSSWCLSPAWPCSPMMPPLWGAGVPTALLWHCWLSLPAHRGTAVTLMLLGWTGICQAPKNKCRGSSLPHSQGCTVTVRVLARACRDGGCLWCFPVSTDRTCWSTGICSPVWQMLLCSGVVFQKTSAPRGSSAWREGPHASEGGALQGEGQTGNAAGIQLGVWHHP